MCLIQSSSTMALIRNCFVLFVMILYVSDVCSKPRITPRIYGGDLAKPYQFPFIASIRAKDVFKFTHVCGGTILSSRLILTAAHCAASHGQDAGAYRVFVGSTGRFDGFAHEIKHFIPHPSNNPLILENDLMFIELVKPIEFSHAVQPAKLHRKEVSNGVRVLAAGSGRTNDDTTALKVVELETITNFQCLSKLISLVSNPPVHRTVLCANSGNAASGVSDGDSGGPLVLLDNMQLVGVTSWAFDSGSKYPDGFTRISSFTDWIDEVLATVDEN